jgi:hypothetical protein
MNGPHGSAAPAAPALADHEVALGATLLPTGEISIPHAAYRQLIDQATTAGRQALELEVAPKILQLGFRDLADMFEGVAEYEANPPPNPMEAYASRAKALGFDDFDDLFGTLEQHGREYDAQAANQPPPAGDPSAMSQPPVTPPGAPAPAPIVAPIVAPSGGPPRPVGAAPGDELINSRKLDEGTRNRISKLREELRGKATAAEQRAAAAEAATARLQTQLDQNAGEEKMKLELVRAGIGAANFDYAWYQIKQKLAEMDKDVTPEGQKKRSEFTATAWATEQRAAAPYLFGETVVPASSGATGGAPQPAPLGAAAVGGQTAGAGAFDARSASPADFRKRMQNIGIDYKGNAPPIR